MEILRVAGGFDDGMAGGDDNERSSEGDVHERKLVCMVSSEIFEGFLIFLLF